MRLVITRKIRNHKKCNEYIFYGGFYYPQRRNKAICFKCGYKGKFKHKALIMKINDLNIGDKFILVRSGDKYINAEYQRDENGIGLKRNFVIPLDKLGNKLPVKTLSLQCEVKIVIRNCNVK